MCRADDGTSQPEDETMPLLIDRPLAAAPYKSWRYHGPFGGIAIGAMNAEEALREAARSLSMSEQPDAGLLEEWNGEEWVRPDLRSPGL